MSLILPWFGRMGPWPMLLVVLLGSVGMLFEANENIPRPVADVTDRYSLEDILADQSDRIGPVAGASARDVLQATSATLSGPSSERITPPEHRPDRRIVS